MRNFVSFLQNKNPFLRKSESYNFCFMQSSVTSYVMIVSFVEMYCIDMSLHTHTASYLLSLSHAIWCWWCMCIASCPPGRYSLLLSRTAQCRVCVFSRPPKAVANNLHYRKLHIQFIKYDSSQLFFLNLRKYCIIGWVNFSELEITVCRSC